MSSTDNRGIPPGNAAIIAAVISAAALVVGALIGVVFGAKSQPIQVFLGADTPTPVVESSILGLPLPQPTYTLLPTYTPYPTLTPARTIVAPRPITVIPTSSADQQDPPPNSVILAGQKYTKNGVILTLRNPISIKSDRFSYSISIENQSGRQLTVLWKNSFIHARDDKGKVYHQSNENSVDWDKNKQFTIPNGGTDQIYTDDGGSGDNRLTSFLASFDPTTKSIIITVDQLIGMTNMNWRYDLQ